MTRRRFASPDLQRTYDRSVGNSPRRALEYEEALVDAEVGQMVHEIRVFEGLTQQELASRIGTTASAISRLESANYRGHSLAMLRRIASAVGQRVVILFLPESERIEPRAWIMNRRRRKDDAVHRAAAKNGRPATRAKRGA